MKDGIERRCHIRAPLKLDFSIETPKGRFRGITADVSISGLSIMHFLKSPEIGDKFEVTLKSSTGYTMSMSCEKVWSGKRVSDKRIYDAIGVRFTYISEFDQSVLSVLIADYYQS